MTEKRVTKQEMMAGEILDAMVNYTRGRQDQETSLFDGGEFVRVETKDNFYKYLRTVPGHDSGVDHYRTNRYRGIKLLEKRGDVRFENGLLWLAKEFFLDGLEIDEAEVDEEGFDEARDEVLIKAALEKVGISDEEPSTNGVERTPAQRERFARMIRGLEEEGDESIAPSVDELEVSPTEPLGVVSDDSHESDDGSMEKATEDVSREEWSAFLGEVDEKADSSFSEPRYNGKLENLINGLSEIFSDLSGKRLTEVRKEKLRLTDETILQQASIAELERKLEETRRVLSVTNRRIMAANVVITQCEKMT